MNDYTKCQYCFFDYDQCTCCKYCSELKGKCDCHTKKDPPTILHPSDTYKVISPTGGKGIFALAGAEIAGIRSGEDADKFVMTTFVKESWPERLKRSEKCQPL